MVRNTQDECRLILPVSHIITSMFLDFVGFITVCNQNFSPITPILLVSCQDQSMGITYLLYQLSSPPLTASIACLLITTPQSLISNSSTAPFLVEGTLHHSHLLHSTHLHSPHLDSHHLHSPLFHSLHLHSPLPSVERPQTCRYCLC